MGDTVKSMRNIINSILVSGAPNMNPTELDIEYHNVTGTRIPYKELGYVDLISCLKDCSDILTLENYNGRIIVQPVVQKNVAHIKRLVNQQKAAPRKKNITKEFKSAPETFSRSNVALHLHNTVTTPHISYGNRPVPSIKSNYNYAFQSQPIKGSAINRPIDVPRNYSNPNLSSIVTQPVKNRPSSASISILEFARAALENNEDGIWCTKFLELYRSKTGEDFNFVKSKYKNALEIFYELQIPISITKSASDYLVKKKSTKNSVPFTSNVNGVEASSLLSDGFKKIPSHDDRSQSYCNSALSERKETIDQKPVLRDLYGSKNIPDNVVMPGDGFESQELPSFAKIGAIIDVIVAEVYSPHNFYIQLDGKYTTLALNELMCSLQQFYTKVSTKNLIMNSHHVVPGQICCCVYGDEKLWHRGIITNLLDREIAEVYYVDYGTIAKVNYPDIYWLHRDYKKLPAQAKNARLANISPVGDDYTWTKNAIICFMKYAECSLAATICDIKDNVLHLTLTNSSTNPISINDLLITGNHAILHTDSDEDLEKIIEKEFGISDSMHFLTLDDPSVNRASATHQCLLQCMKDGSEILSSFYLMYSEFQKQETKKGFTEL